MSELYRMAYAAARRIEPQAMPVALHALVARLVADWLEQGERR